MSHRSSKIAVALATAMTLGALAARDALSIGVSLDDYPVQAEPILPAGAEPAGPSEPQGYQGPGVYILGTGTWVAMKPNSFLKVGAAKIPASTVPQLYRIEGPIENEPEGFDYRAKGNVEGLARDIDFETPERTIEALSALIRINPRDHVLYDARGRMALGLRRYREATLDYDEAVRLAPSFGQAYLYRGIANYESKKYERGLGDLHEAIRLDRQNVDAYYMRARLAIEAGNLDRATSDFTTLLQLDPSEDNVRKSLKEMDESRKTDQVAQFRADLLKSASEAPTRGLRHGQADKAAKGKAGTAAKGKAESETKQKAEAQPK
jgi:tetratricopeptide (TPR) repeat protein